MLYVCVHVILNADKTKPQILIPTFLSDPTSLKGSSRFLFYVYVETFNLVIS